MELQVLAKHLQKHYADNPSHQADADGSCCKELADFVSEYRSERRTTVAMSQPSLMAAKIMYLNLTSEPVYQSWTLPKKGDKVV